MFQPATLGLCISLLAEMFPLGAGTRVDLAAGARAELNAGRIPVTSIANSAPGTEETIVLRSGIRLISPTTMFSLSYLPRYYLRLPDALHVGRPLILHDAALAWSAQPSRRLSLNWNVRGSGGEIANSALTTVFDPGTGTIDVSVVPILQLNSSFGVGVSSGKRQQTSLTVGGGHYGSFGETAAIQESNNLSASISHSIGLSGRTSVGISAQGGLAVPGTDDPSATVGGQLSLRQRVRESAGLSIAVGLSRGWILGGEISWPLPTFDLGYQTVLKATGQSWALNFNGGTRAFFDVTSAIYRPQLFLAAAVSGKILNRWTVGSNLNFSADISGTEAIQGVQPTQFNFNLPVAYHITAGLDFAFGLRLGLSGPPLTDFTSGVFQEQISLYVAFDWTTGTEKSRGGWLR